MSLNNSIGNRPGFTKTEVLVACVCLVVLLGLLLPAVNSGPTSARRTLCASRLSQLVMAFMQYERARQQYPGYLNAFALDKDETVKVGTWAVSVLPYIEQEELYDTWMDPSSTGQWNRRGGSSSKINAHFYPNIRMFTCPSDSNEGDMQAACSFAVNAGFFPDIRPPAYAMLNPHEAARHSSRPANGIFSNQLPSEMECVHTKHKRTRVLGSRSDVPTRASDIRDGLTQTIAITESINADSWAQVGPDYGWGTVEIDGVEYAGDDLSDAWSPRVRVGVVWQYKAQPPVSGVMGYMRPSFPRISQKRTFTPELASPSSYHKGLFNVGMAGGSVATISKEIDYRVLQALMTPHTKSSDVPDTEYVLRDDDYQ